MTATHDFGAIAAKGAQKACKPRIAVISSLCVERDAISESARGTVEALSELADVRLVTYRCDYSEINAITVQSIRDLILHPFYNSAEILFYHYGVYYDLFDTVLIGNGHAKRIVYFHNVTPKQLLSANAHSLADKSLRQRANIQAADRVLVNSDFTRNDLIDLGMNGDGIEVCPLYVRFRASPVRRTRSAKSPQVKLLYVGRFVESKGVLDLIEAAAALCKEHCDFHLCIAGNLTFSDPAYVVKIKQTIVSRGLSAYVTFEGEVSDTALEALYSNSDIFVMPSYHEGFCVPIIEAYHAGCIPVAYDAGNLPTVVGDCGILVKTGDKTELTSVLHRLVRQFGNGFPPEIDLGRGAPIPRSAYQALVAEHLARHDFDRFASNIRACCGLS